MFQPRAEPEMHSQEGLTGRWATDRGIQFHKRKEGMASKFGVVVHPKSLLITKKDFIYVDKRSGEYEFTFYYAKWSLCAVPIILFDEIGNEWWIGDGWQI